MVDCCLQTYLVGELLVGVSQAFGIEMLCGVQHLQELSVLTKAAVNKNRDANTNHVMGLGSASYS